MKRNYPFILTMILLILWVFPGEAAGETSAVKRTGEVMHPRIDLLDDLGNRISAGGVEISTQRTCGQCHDTQYINNHNNHFNAGVKVDCLVCHFEGGRVGEDYTSAHLRIRLPADENCAGCHGVVQVGSDPLFFPEDYEKNLEYCDGKNYYGITQHTGVVLSPQDLANSALNLKEKNRLHFPWDVHSRRQLECISCHFIGNDPRYCGKIPSTLDHLIMDPRQIKSPGEILKRPDHNLKTASCTCCHNPFRVHKHLPYKKRHMEVLSCQSCHVAEIYGPAFQTVDRTVMTREGIPRIQYRGTDENVSHGSSLNTMYFEGFQPFLFPHPFQPVNPNEVQYPYKISPFNLVTYWSWKSKQTGEAVPEPLLRQVFLDGSGGFATDIIDNFDRNKDSTLESAELVLDSKEKLGLIREKLEKLGIAEPVITGEVHAYPINHGVVETLHQPRDCSHCHAQGAGFGREVVLSDYSVAGILPEFAGDNLPLVNGNITRDKEGRVVLARNSSLSGHYIFGHSRNNVLDRLGFWVFLLALLGIIIHGLLRWFFSLRHPPRHGRTRKVYMYRFYERLWHWTMATGILVLVITGLEIHHTGSFAIFGLEYAVSLHNILAAILVVNAVLSLFYHLTTGEIKQFFGFNRKFIQEAAVQAYYYLYGIFKRKPHPLGKTVERKLNPLQQLTYIGLLNVLLPFQVVTGILIWGADRWPLVSEKLGGLAFLAPVHHLGSWLFLGFLAVHIYLTTTGHTVFSNIRAMITGYDEVAEDEPDEEQRRLMDMKMMDLVGTLINKISRRERPSVNGGK